MSPLTTTDTPKITLVGAPNSGKTTLFNLLSGKNYKTVNYPGSTVEYNITKIQSKYELECDLLDSPGLISLFPFSPDEKVTVDSLYNHPHFGSPDLIINTVDSSQLTRHLLLTKQLLESGFKVIIVLTMKDILQRRGSSISEELLINKIGCDVVNINGRTGEGIEKLIELIQKNLKELKNTPYRSEPRKISTRLNKDNLVNSFNEIEKIVAEVTGNNKSLVTDIASANQALKILNQPVASKVASNPDEITMRIDKILLHRFWGLILFVLIMALTFTSIFYFADPLMGIVDNFFSWLNGIAAEGLGDSWFSSLISDGIISGSGAVLVFVPQIIILFVILGILEDTGYLARGAMLIDKPLSKIGLNGRSFVPMLSGYACAIPAMLAARTIPNRKERMLTLFIIPLTSCSARLPVYALLIAYLTPADKPWIGGIILASIYIFSLISSMIAAAIANKFRRIIFKADESSSFILELPTYKIPKFSSVLSHTYNSTKQYLIKAGPVILTFSIVIWFLTYFPDYKPQIDTTNLSSEMIESRIDEVRFENSYAAGLGKFIQPLMTPIGMDWRIGVSLISAFAAREVFVSSLALIFKVTDDNSDISQSLLTSMKAAEIDDTGQKLFTTSTIFGLIVFFMFALQCISTLAVGRKEMGTWKIPLFQLFAFTSIAYLFAFITVNGLRFLGVP